MKELTTFPLKGSSIKYTSNLTLSTKDASRLMSSALNSNLERFILIPNDIINIF